jgi:hypothetical protein
MRRGRRCGRSVITASLSVAWVNCNAAAPTTTSTGIKPPAVARIKSALHAVGRKPSAVERRRYSSNSCTASPVPRALNEAAPTNTKPRPWRPEFKIGSAPRIKKKRRTRPTRPSGDPSVGAAPLPMHQRSVLATRQLFLLWAAGAGPESTADVVGLGYCILRPRPSELERTNAATRRDRAHCLFGTRIYVVVEVRQIAAIGQLPKPSPSSCEVAGGVACHGEGAAKTPEQSRVRRDRASR